ncbi:hypothetical protein IW152_003893 [Coemansia sp. BCRC 34962]|nr:hypothetical protein IW152_003893 [Coemansia sp. BCRC 34962]
MQAPTSSNGTRSPDPAAQQQRQQAVVDTPPPPVSPHPQQPEAYGRLKVRAADVKSFRAKPPTLLEKGTLSGKEPKRLIFIGDIHGSLKELNLLLCKLKFKRNEDQVVLVGDLVAKGPESVGVVRRARQLNAWCVRGNHDDRVIRWREFLDGPGATLSESELKSLEKSGGLPYDDFKLGKDHYQIARDLSPDDIAWMKSLPTILSLPPPYSQWVVVHGGLDPSKPLLKQSAEDVMVTRNIASSGPTSSRDEGQAWFELWADKMKGLSPGSSAEGGADLNFDEVHYNKIIYGHDAGRSLQLHPLTKGLDSRCVYGGQLTAFVLPGEKTVSVTCPNYDGGSGSDGKDRRRRRRDSIPNAKAEPMFTLEEGEEKQ